MSASVATQTISKIPGWGWGLLIAGGVYWYIFIRKDKEEQKEEERHNEEVASGEEDLETLARKGIKPRWTKTQYMEMANILFSAMTGGGTDEDAIMRQIYHIRNQADWLLLKQYFDVRGGRDLVSWLRSELNLSEITAINKALAKVGVSSRV